MQNFQDFQQNGQSCAWNGPFMDAINIVSFLIGLQNLQLNVTSADLDKQTNQILSEVHSHLKKQDDQLVLQDKHLLEQDVHLREQNERIERLERIVLEISTRQKGDKNNGQVF